MSTPSSAEFLERVVAALTGPSVDPDLTVGQAVWQLFRTGAEAWSALSLRPVGGGREAFDAVYEATQHGLHVIDVQVAARGRALAPAENADDMHVLFGGEVVAVFRISRTAPGGRETLAALAGAAPAIGILLVALAQRRRMNREIGHLQAVARLNEGLWSQRDVAGLIDTAAAEIRAGWQLERVRIFRPGDREGEAWPLAAEARLEGGSAKGGPLPYDLVARVGRARRSAIARISPSAWLVPVTDGEPPRGAVLLDNALTGHPLERADDLVRAVRALAVAWSRLPDGAARPGRPGTSGPTPSQAPATVVEKAIGAADSHLVLWRLLGPAARSRRRDRRLDDEAARELERLVPPRFRFVVASADTFAALLDGASTESARELAESSIDALAQAWRLVAAVVVLGAPDPTPAPERGLGLLAAAATLYDGAVVADGDRWQVATGGGLAIAKDAVLRPSDHTLRLATGPVPLTRTEVRLLAALGLAPAPVPAHDLVRRVWPGDPTVGVMNLYPHIHGLRRRLIQAWPEGLRVRTIRGQGYTLAREGEVGDLG